MKGSPLVIFIPDASVNQNDPRLSLLHGEGATGFAYPRVQDINPSFILAFQIPPRIAFVSDDFTCAEEFDDLKKIIDDVCRENPIDVNRIYILGGSQGCMSACELNCRYPDFFAASVLAGGQWDSEKMGKCCPGCNFWIKQYRGKMYASDNNTFWDRVQRTIKRNSIFSSVLTC